MPFNIAKSETFGGSMDPAHIHNNLPDWANFTNEKVHAVGGSLAVALEGLRAQASCCCYSSDGQHVAVGGGAADPRVLVFSTHTGKLVSEMRGHTAAVTNCMFTLSDAQLVSSSQDGSCKLWDAASGKLVKSFTHAGGVESVDVSWDQKLLACTVKQVGGCWACVGLSHIQPPPNPDVS
jgi:WD40 repeat protein